jgi:pilus assembly protein CpaB
MKSKSLILIVIACGCGLVASIGISQVMDRGGGPAAVDTTQILVALNDVNINDKLDAQNVKLEDWPKDRVPEGSYSKLEDIKDQFTRARLYKGEPIIKAKLSSSPGGPAPIPTGYRVVPIRVDSANIAEVVQPGDRVDVLVFMHKSAEIPVTTTKTVLTDVRIWAVNDKTERAKDKENETIQARTVSVLIKPDQVEMLMLAMELGKIKLSLRRPDDKSKTENNDGTSVSELFSRPGTPGSEPVAEAPKPSFVDFLNKAKTPAAPAPQEVVAEPAVPSGPIKRMVVHTPDGIKLYQWNRENELPVVITMGEGGGPASAPALPTPGSVKNSGPAEPDADDKE